EGERELAGGGRSGDILLERLACAPFSVELCRIEGVAALSCALDLAESGVGLPHQRIEIRAVIGEARYADRHADLEIDIRPEAVRLGELPAQSVCDGLELGRALLLRLHDQDLVGAQARDEIDIRACLPDPLGKGAQEPVSDLVAADGVDGAE